MRGQGWAGTLDTRLMGMLDREYNGGGGYRLVEWDSTVLDLGSTD